MERSRQAIRSGKTAPTRGSKPYLGREGLGARRRHARLAPIRAWASFAACRCGRVVLGPLGCRSQRKPTDPARPKTRPENSLLRPLPSPAQARSTDFSRGRRWFAPGILVLATVIISQRKRFMRWRWHRKMADRDQRGEEPIARVYRANRQAPGRRGIRAGRGKPARIPRPARSSNLEGGAVFARLTELYESSTYGDRRSRPRSWRASAANAGESTFPPDAGID